MPIYVYRCDICGREVEDLRPAAERDVQKPLCVVSTPAAQRHAVRMVRVPAAGAFVVNGFNAKNHYSKGQA